MKNFKLAVISDIHGNSSALKEVLADIKKRKIDYIVNLGDSLYGPLDPAGTADILIEMNIPSVCGNEDRILIEEDKGGHNSPSLQFTKNALTDRHREWIKSQSAVQIILADIIMFHGTPGNDHEYLLNKISNGGLVLRDEAEITERLKGVDQRVILCGHDHTPNVITLADGRIILNPGSVGCPAYFDDAEPIHKVENGNPYAKYSILTKQDSKLYVEQVAIEYDWNYVAEIALKNGRPDWVNCLKYGRVS